MPTPAKPDPVYLSARREALVALVIFVTAMTYTVSYCYLNGYGRKVEDLTFVLGFPDWIFWGVVTPWLVCLGTSWIFAFWLMTDEDLGAELDEDGDDVSSAESTHA